MKTAILFATFCRTKERTDYAVRTIAGIRKNMLQQFSPPGYLGIYLADSGSAQPHLDALHAALDGATMVGEHNVYRAHARNCDAGFEACWRAEADIVMYLEDDFELQQPFDIQHYCDTLVADNRVGIIRLGLLPIDLQCYTVGSRGRIYLQMERTTQYAFSGNPLLMHRRFWDAYGGFDNDYSPGESELRYDAKFRSRLGPEIWRPVDLGSYGPFGHIGEV